MKLSEVDQYYWGYGEKCAFVEWMKKNPSWKDAEVLNTSPEDKDFYKYMYNVGFSLKKNNKMYNFFIKKNLRGWGHGVLVKNIGERIIKKRKNAATYSYNNTQNHVINEGQEYKNSCQLWCFASLLDISYEEAYKHLSAQGWAPDNTYSYQERWKKALGLLNKNLVVYWERAKKIKGHSLKNVLKIVPQKGKFLIVIRGHVLSVIDGQVYDNTQSSPYCHIKKIFEIE